MRVRFPRIRLCIRIQATLPAILVNHINQLADVWQPERDITPVNDETMQEINTLLIALDKTWDDDLLPLCSQIFRRDIRASSELTQAEAVKALGFLKQKAAEQKVAA